MLIETLTSTIASAGTTGGAINMRELLTKRLAIAGMLIPAAYDKISMTFDVSVNGSTWAPLKYPNGDHVTVVCEASTLQAVAMPPVDTCGFPFLRPVAPSAVGANAAIKFTLRVV